MAVATPLDDYDPHITPDGLDLYYAPNQGSGQAIVFASRASTSDSFAVVRTMTELSTPPYSDPSVSPDELVIAFATGSPADLYMATRTDRTDQFQTPVRVPTVNSTARETDSELTHDGCQLYFSSDRTGNREIYVADVIP